jgi:hypothetical protein
MLLAGDEEAVAGLLRDEPAGIAEERRRYLMSAAKRRGRDLVAELRDLYDGQCQICGRSPRQTYGAELCEGHHVRWLSRGGSDSLANLTLVCPNHRRAIPSMRLAFRLWSKGFRSERQ